MPTQLCRLNEVEIANVGDRVIADFKVGICPKEVELTVDALVAAGIQNPEVRILRGLDATVEKMQLGQMFPSFDPRIEVLGDPGNFEGFVKYRISLYSGYNRRSLKKAWEVLQSLFEEESIDAYVAVSYHFSSVYAGKLTDSSSQVAVYIARQSAKH